MQSRARTGFLALVMMASAGLLSAQTRTGTINGTVTDESGAVLPAVTVTLTSEALITRTSVATTDQEGNYRFVALLPGSYNLKFELTGFVSTARTGIRVESSFVATVNTVITIGGVQETVTIPLETRGTFRYPNVSILDLRASKMFKIDNRSFEAMVDLFNAQRWHGDEPGDNARLVLRQAIEAALTADRRLRCAVQILTGGDMNRASTTLVAIATLTGALTASPPSPAVPAQKAGRLLTIGTLVDTKHPSAPLRISRRRGDAPLAGFRATGGRGKLVAFKLFPNW
jgi:hypothetical protein